MRVVFMGTPEFAVPSLEKLVQNGYEVLAVYTQPDRPAGRGRKIVFSPVKEAAMRMEIPVFQPANLRDRTELDTLRSLGPELIVVAAFGQILRQQVLEIPPCGCINVHASLLPRLRGAAPISSAILEGDRKTGVTIMVMDAGMDTGPIITQAEEPINDEDTTGSLSARLAEVGARLLVETLPRFVAGEVKPVPQDNDRATYTRLLRKEQGEIDWSRPAIEIWRQIRAFQPWPGSYTHLNNRQIKMIKAVPFYPGTETEPGYTVLLEKEYQGSRLSVGTGDGLLVLQVIQPEGKREMSAREFLLGQRNMLPPKLGKDETKG